MLAPPFEKGLCLSRYLQVVRLAYASLEELPQGLSNVELYKKMGDGRDGGLLNLPPTDKDAFRKWFLAKEWSGCNPWEILFGVPQGVVLSPVFNKKTQKWHFSLSVSSFDCFLKTLHIYFQLIDQNIPVIFKGWSSVLDALSGKDRIQVGPSGGMYSLEALKAKRPDGLHHIDWSALPLIHPISPENKIKVVFVEKNGSAEGLHF